MYVTENCSLLKAIVYDWRCMNSIKKTTFYFGIYYGGWLRLCNNLFLFRSFNIIQILILQLIILFPIQVGHQRRKYFNIDFMGNTFKDILRRNYWVNIYWNKTWSPWQYSSSLQDGPPLQKFLTIFYPSFEVFFLRVRLTTWTYYPQSAALGRIILQMKD